MNHAPSVIVLMGIPGSGKTTVARHLQLSRRQRWFISRDDIRAALFQPCQFTPLEKETAFDAVVLALQANLMSGRPCIVDGMPFSRRSERERVAAVASARRAICVFVFLDVSPETAAARVEQDRDVGIEHFHDRDSSLVYEVAERFEDLGKDVLRIDGTLKPAVIARTIEEALVSKLL